MTKCSISLLSLLCSTLLGASLTIYNDSPYMLTCTIFSNDGKNVGSMTMAPKHQAWWQSSFQNSDNYRDVMTPFTVVFSCPSNYNFGVWTQVPTGATINAMGSQGQHYCEPVKEPLRAP